MRAPNLLRAADESINSLLSWGIGGIILAVFVAPTFWLMVRAAQKREDDRSKADEEEARLRRDREKQLVDALTQSVKQQAEALAQWRQFEAQEEKVHAALLSGLTNLNNLLTAQQRAAETTATAQNQIAQLLGDVATTIHQLKAAA